MNQRRMLRELLLVAVTGPVMLTAGCTGPLPGEAHPCAPGGPEDASEGTTAGLGTMQEAAARVREEVYANPGVAASWVDEENGRLVYEVASGDDAGATTCAALVPVLDQTGLPYSFEVFEGPVERTIRTTVGFDEAWTEDGENLGVNAWSCNGNPEVTVLEETAEEVRLEITATVATQGRPSQGCLDTVTVTLKGPLDGRTLVDLTTGETVEVFVRAPA